MTTQPEALRLADILEKMPLGECDGQAAAELRRLHAENEALREANARFGKRQEWWNDRMFDLEAERDALLEALKQCQAALEALWQPADSIYQRAADAADRAIAKAEENT